MNEVPFFICFFIEHFSPLPKQNWHATKSLPNDGECRNINDKAAGGEEGSVAVEERSRIAGWRTRDVSGKTYKGRYLRRRLKGGGGRVERYREEVLPFLIAFLKVVRPDEDREGGCLSSEEPAKN